jgi:hypothetical protein
MNNDRLSLSKALASGRLHEFIAQEEKRGVGPVEKAKLEALLKEASKPKQSADRTSRSAFAGGSSEK